MVRRKIVLCTESLRITRAVSQQPEQYSYDGRAVIRLLKNSIDSLRSGAVEIVPVGFEGKNQFMKELPLVVRNTFATYRHLHDSVEVFVIALRDSDTCEGKRYPVCVASLLTRSRE